MSARAKKGRAGGDAAAGPRLKLVATPAQRPAGAPQFLTVAQVAALLHLRPKTIYNMVSQRRIPFRRAGHQLLFDTREIDAWTKSAPDKQ
ncbi:MAG TPA: helix-turn-helix domain-containing protein [Pyrinomonadaceae bacterium]